jgi:esterase/lipase superfamily enzyme
MIRGDGPPVLIGFGTPNVDELCVGICRRLIIRRLRNQNYSLPEYSEPGGTASAGVDVYGIAAVMYRALTGRPPSDAKQRLRVARRYGNDTYLTVGSAGLRVLPTRMVDTIDRALALNTEARPHSIAEFRAGLDWDMEPVNRRVRAELAVEAFRRGPPRDVGRLLSSRAVALLFATNRQQVIGPRDRPSFNHERKDNLIFGATRVHVPNDHKIGRLELPRRIRFFGWRIYNEDEDPERHFLIDNTVVFPRSEFINTIRLISPRTALVFVHGFNTIFEDSILRFAQILWDIQFRGIPILFSWPSHGGLLNYLYDKDSVVTARQRFVEMLDILHKESRVEMVHILAHSMGNMIVLEALDKLVSAPSRRGFSEVVMAAPDVDIDVFRALAPRIRPLVRGMTLYASSKDKALVISRKLANSPRAGDVWDDGPIILAEIDSIDVSAIGEELFGLNHNTFATNRSLIDDIGRILDQGIRPPDRRSPQIRGVPDDGTPPRYWQYPK